VQVDVLVLEGAPEALDEDIVQSPSSAIHTDADSLGFQTLAEGAGGELSSLIGVEHVGASLVQGLLKGVEAEGTVKGVGELPGQHITAEPVDDGYQVHKTASHGDVGNVGTPHLVRACDGQSPQQVGVNAILRVRDRGTGFGIDRLNAHHAVHQSLHSLGIHRIALRTQVGRHPSIAVERRLQVLGINETHQLEVERGLLSRGIVITRTSQAQELTLPPDAQMGMSGFNHGSPILDRRAPTFF